ncbi:MAG: tetratricopeptide repeat protein [Moorea sp. SIOASIH]|uniref:tetratricopeptide repeat protein n=1 Tax=Moorena sp. SIOASIH TaxID=2607817 RepID=UPI0013BD2641|nr:tetratricopeptide repeat protein [Moorena sp. SIOASIH]NEO41913.1 tetratricopeptide repeat protein [Moorena sp. SIOASIH]
MPYHTLVLSQYRAALQSLATDSPLTDQQALEILCARDALNNALTQEPFIPAELLECIHELDAQLQQQGQRIDQALELSTYRHSLPAKPKGWWWYLDQQRPPHPLDRYDWVFKGLTFGSWSVSLALLVNIASRFLSGGLDVVGTSAIIVPTLITLLKAKSDLTEEDQKDNDFSEALKKGFEELLISWKVPKFLHAETKFLSTIALLLGLLGFWYSLPRISGIYDRRGFDHYKAGELSSAEANYQRAIALDPDNANAHYKLAVVYEDWLQLKKSKQEYQLAVSGKIPRAYNNLARLYILEKDYPKAANLLVEGLKLTTKQSVYPQDKYNLYKNLGWVRFKQNRDYEAKIALDKAINIAKDPDVAKYLPNRASASCILAQVLERQEKPEAPNKSLKQWEHCRNLIIGNPRISKPNKLLDLTNDLGIGNPWIPEEDTWLHLANQRIQKAQQQKQRP